MANYGIPNMPPLDVNNIPNTNMESVEMEILTTSDLHPNDNRQNVARKFRQHVEMPTAIYKLINRW